MCVVCATQTNDCLVVYSKLNLLNYFLVYSLPNNFAPEANGSQVKHVIVFLFS